MSNNASHVVVHHMFDNFHDATLFAMVCVVLSVVVVILLIALLGLVIYIVVQRKKKQSVIPTIDIIQNRSRAIANSYGPENLARQRTLSNPVSFLSSRTSNINLNVENIPMSTLRVPGHHHQDDSLLSSSGLCNVLYPGQHHGEVIYERPQPAKVTTFPVPDGPESNRRPEASGSGVHQNASFAINSNSMEWDYYESRRYSGSNVSGEDLEDGKDNVAICWV